MSNIYPHLGKLQPAPRLENLGFESRRNLRFLPFGMDARWSDPVSTSPLKMYTVNYVAPDWSELPFSVDTKQLCLLPEPSTQAMHLVFVSPTLGQELSSAVLSHELAHQVSFIPADHALASSTYSVEHLASFTAPECGVINWLAGGSIRALCSVGIALLSQWSQLDPESRHAFSLRVGRLLRNTAAAHSLRFDLFLPGPQTHLLIACSIAANAPPWALNGTSHSESMEGSAHMAA
jgi:hypothetical protein